MGKRKQNRPRLCYSGKQVLGRVKVEIVQSMQCGWRQGRVSSFLCLGVDPADGSGARSHSGPNSKGRLMVIWFVSKWMHIASTKKRTTNLQTKKNTMWQE